MCGLCMARGVDNGMARLMVELDRGNYQDQFMSNALRRVNKPSALAHVKLSGVV